MHCMFNADSDVSVTSGMSDEYTGSLATALRPHSRAPSRQFTGVSAAEGVNGPRRESHQSMSSVHQKAPTSPLSRPISPAPSFTTLPPLPASTFTSAAPYTPVAAGAGTPSRGSLASPRQLSMMTPPRLPLASNALPPLPSLGSTSRLSNASAGSGSRPSVFQTLRESVEEDATALSRVSLSERDGPVPTTPAAAVAAGGPGHVSTPSGFSSAQQPMYGADHDDAYSALAQGHSSVLPRSWDQLRSVQGQQ